MKIVYMSDLHFEINGLGRANQPFESGDVLVLAGDIGTASHVPLNRTDPESRKTRKAWDYMRKEIFPQYKKIFKILGNHTHYGHVYKKTYGVMKDYLSDVPNLQILENEVCVFGGVKFLGCTLWTNFDNDNPAVKYFCEKRMNDYYLILEKSMDELDKYDQMIGKKMLITSDFTLKRHQESVRFLESELEKQDELPVVVLTHHCPTYQSINPRYKEDGLNGAYASDLSEMILDNQQIFAWIHGHTHFNKNYQVGKTWVISNQCGYYDSYEYKVFKPNRYLEIQEEEEIVNGHAVVANAS